MASKGAWWKPDKFASVTWLGLFMPGLVCFLHFLSMHLNQYAEVKGSKIERYSQKLDDIIPKDAKVRTSAENIRTADGQPCRL